MSRDRACPRRTSRSWAASTALATCVCLLVCACQDTGSSPRETGGSSGTGATGGDRQGTGGASGGASGGARATGGVATTGGASAETGGSSGNGGQGGRPAATGGQAAGGASTGGRAGGGAAGSTAASGGGGMGGSLPGLPDPGPAGDGDSTVGPTYTTQPDLGDRGNPKGQTFRFSMRLADSKIFNGKDPTVDANRVSVSRAIEVYVPKAYKDGDPAPVLVIQDGRGPIDLVARALDNLTNATDPQRKLPAFIAVAVQSGGDDSIGSERGLEYDTLSDRYARFIDQEVLPAVQANAQVKAAYPNLKFTKDPSGRAALGCSSGGAAAFTMAWFRPDLFSRVIGYSTTLVAQQDPASAEAKIYPEGAWDYHSSQELIKKDTTGREKLLRIFINANQNDLRATDPESTHHNWLMANQRTAAALKAKGFHYKFIEGMGVGHCDDQVKSATLADVLVWVWRGYQPSGN